MINFIINNPFISLLIAVVIVSLILILILTRIAKKTENGKSSTKVTGKPKVEQAIKVDGPIFYKSDTELVDGHDPNTCFLKKNKKVNKPNKKALKRNNKMYTFVSLKKRREMKWFSREQEEKALLHRMEFVKSDKRVSKLATREQMLGIQKSKKEPEPLPEPVKVEEEKPSKDECKMAREAKYFNKNRRLSNYINVDDPDSMFESHISDVYMNIDSNRHLNIDKAFNKQLYDRAAKVLAHGEIKITDDADLSVKANRKRWIKQRSKEEYKNIMRYDEAYQNDFLDDELAKDEVDNEFIEDNYNEDLEGYNISANINLEPQNILTVDSILHRKNNYKRGQK